MTVKFECLTMAVFYIEVIFTILLKSDSFRSSECLQYNLELEIQSGSEITIFTKKYIIF